MRVLVVEDETSAVAAVGRLSSLNRTEIRKVFEQRFTARRMALAICFRSSERKLIQSVNTTSASAPLAAASTDGAIVTPGRSGVGVAVECNAFDRSHEG